MSALGLLRNIPQLVGLEEEARRGKLIAGLHRLASEVEASWESMPEDRREALKAFAYLAVDPPRDLSTRLTLGIGRLSMAFRMLRGDEEEVAQLVLAAHRLIHAVLDAIERENPEYVALLNERLTELDLERIGDLPTVPESESERREWIKGLLRKTDA